MQADDGNGTGSPLSTQITIPIVVRNANRALDVVAGGFVGMSFYIQTYPSLAEWLAYDFEGL